MENRSMVGVTPSVGGYLGQAKTGMRESKRKIRVECPVCGVVCADYTGHQTVAV